MNAAHLHITLVHIPVVLMPISCMLLAIGLLRSQPTIQRTALALIIVASLVTIPSFLLGEEAEEIVEHLPGVLESLIHNHEEASELALWITIASGVGSIMSWFLSATNRRAHRLALQATLVTATVAAIALGYTAQLGGKIRHPEAFKEEPSKAAQHEHSHDHSHEHEAHD